VTHGLRYMAICPRGVLKTALKALQRGVGAGRRLNGKGRSRCEGSRLETPSGRVAGR